MASRPRSPAHDQPRSQSASNPVQAASPPVGSSPPTDGRSGPVPYLPELRPESDAGDRVAERRRPRRKGGHKRAPNGHGNGRPAKAKAPAGDNGRGHKPAGPAGPPAPDARGAGSTGGSDVRDRGPEDAAEAVESSAQTSAKPIVGTLVPQRHGGLLQIGNPGNKGGGRTPDERKRRFREIVSSPDADRMLESIIRGESFLHKGALVLVDPDTFLKAHAYCDERGYGRPVPETELEPEGKARGKTLTVRLVHSYERTG